MVPPTTVLCGGTKLPKGARANNVISLNLHGTNRNVVLKATDISRKLASNIPQHLIDLLEVASYVYCADLQQSRGGIASFDYGSKWRRSFHFVIPVRCPEMWSAVAGQKLSQALSFIADEHYEFSFVHGPDLPGNTDPYFEFPKDSALGSSADQVLLYSGGLDSLGGVIQSAATEHRQVALVSHRSSGKVAGYQAKLVQLFKEMNRETRVFHVPIWVHQTGMNGQEATQRTRGFLYSALACAVAAMYGLKTIHFYENGITSLNLPISEQIVGARASRSTHPQAQQHLADFYSSLLEEPFDIRAPFVWKTKTDVVNLVGDAGYARLIDASRSCLHVRDSTNAETHCGKCSQCISRRFGTLASRYAQYDTPGLYKFDLLTDERAQGSDRILLESYMRFAEEIRELSDTEFLVRFPEFYRVATFLPGAALEVARQVIDLHRRHSDEIDRVLSEGIRDNASKIRRKELPQHCGIMLSIPKGQKSKQLHSTFPTPPGTSWQDIEIRFMDGETVSISCPKLARKPYSYIQMGMYSQQNKKPTVQWELLRQFAHGRGWLTWKDSAANEKNQKRREMLSKDLCRFFKIKSNPFEYDTVSTGWRLKIRIHPDAFDATEISAIAFEQS